MAQEKNFNFVDLLPNQQDGVISSVGKIAGWSTVGYGAYLLLNTSGPIFLLSVSVMSFSVVQVWEGAKNIFSDGELPAGNALHTVQARSR